MTGTGLVSVEMVEIWVLDKVKVAERKGFNSAHQLGLLRLVAHGGSEGGGRGGV